MPKPLRGQAGRIISKLDKMVKQHFLQLNIQNSDTTKVDLTVHLIRKDEISTSHAVEPV